MKDILIILNGIIGSNPPLSGGDIRPLELAQYWEKKGFKIHILSSETAKKICKNFTIHPKFHIMPNWTIDNSKINYIIRTFQAVLFTPKSLEKVPLSFVYSSNDSLFDVIPGLILKIKRPSIIWISLVHIIPPFPPWKRKNTSPIASTLFFISQRASLFLMNIFADKIVAVSDFTYRKLKQMNFNTDKVKVSQCAVPYNEIVSIASKVKTKKYDAVFMKRLQRAKGVFDLIPIWKQIVKKKKDSKLLILGSGNTDEVEELKSFIVLNGLESNIIFKGHVQNLEEKITLLAQSRVYIHPSYEENWSIVIAEALAAGLPVVAYDLPELREVWKENIIYIQLGNTSHFSKEVFAKFKKSSVKLNQEFVKQFDTKKIAEHELKLLLG